jgi:hypothetical protein
VNTRPDSISPSRPPGAKQRRLRNFLLDPRFQLKYTGMVVAVTVVVAGVLGHRAYEYSTGQTELFNIQRMDAQAGSGEPLDEAFVADLDAYAREADRKVKFGILIGILVMTMALGLTGIVITHRLVGPAYRLRRLLRDVSRGRMVIEHGLRKGDELQEVFAAYQQMVTKLRERSEQDVEHVEAALAKAREAGVSPEVVSELEQVRDRLRGVLAQGQQDHQG